MRLESDITLELFPPTRLPAIHVELVRIERSNWHRRIGSYGIVGGDVFGSQLELAFFRIARFGQTVDGQTQAGQYIVVDNVVEEHSFRIERLRRQDHAIVKAFVFTDGPIPKATLKADYVD